MGILSNDPAEGALVALNTLYTIECKTINGGFCQNSAAEHLGNLLVLPGIPYESYEAMMRKQIRDESEWYAREWGIDRRTIKIKFHTNIFEPKKRFVTLYFKDSKIAIYTIRDKYDFEK